VSSSKHRFLEDANEHIQELEDLIWSLEARLADRRWIPETEELPEEGEEVLVWVPAHSFQNICARRPVEGKPGEWVWHDGIAGAFYPSSVTHWMPLPDPPTE
jgi:hypothetical protein